MRISRRTFVAGASCALGLGFPARAQQKGGTLTAIIQPEPPILMIGINQQAPTQTVAGKIYQSLLRYDFDLSPKPCLAKSWTISPDGLTYTFHLEENVLWHDGQPFTSADVLFSCMQFLPETNARARLVFSRVESATAPDPHTVVFRLKENFGPFLNCFETNSTPMIPKHIYEGTDYRTNPANQTPIGTGPFKLAEWKRGQFIRLARNEDYWRSGLPYLDQIIYRVIPDAASRRIALETGEVQLSSFSDIEWFDVPALRANPTLDSTDKGLEFFSPLAWMEINHRVAPFNDKRFRQALYYALDRNFIRDRIFFGLGKVATGPIASTTPFYSEDVKIYNRDLAKAEALLDEMGLKRKSDGKRVTIKFFVMPYGEAWTRLAEYAKQAWAPLGIETVLETTDAGIWAQRFANWDYEITFNYVYQFGDPAIGVSRTYVSTNIKKGVLLNNTMGYVNPEVDDLFEKAAAAKTRPERADYYNKVQKVLTEDVPVLWLLELKFPTFTSKHVKNVITSGTGANDGFDTVFIEQ
jgi:peptide/nickel transport system substrate-binding protein